MKSSELSIFSITVKGRHPDFITKRYKGLAESIGRAMELADERARTDGWEDIDFDEVTYLDHVSFAPWLSELTDQDDRDDELDRQSARTPEENRQFEITEDPQ